MTASELSPKRTTSPEFGIISVVAPSPVHAPGAKRDMTEGFKDKFAKMLTLTLLGVIFVVGALSVWPTYLRGRSLKRQDAELTRRIEEKKREIATLIEYQRRFRTDADFVEHIARRNNRVFPGELVFVFED